MLLLLLKPRSTRTKLSVKLVSHSPRELGAISTYPSTRPRHSDLLHPQRWFDTEPEVSGALQVWLAGSACWCYTVQQVPVALQLRQSRNLVATCNLRSVVSFILHKYTRYLWHWRRWRHGRRWLHFAYGSVSQRVGCLLVRLAPKRSASQHVQSAPQRLPARPPTMQEHTCCGRHLRRDLSHTCVCIWLVLYLACLWCVVC